MADSLDEAKAAFRAAWSGSVRFGGGGEERSDMLGLSL
jgi:hypothetical protein